MHETPGVTRDRKELVCEWNGRRFLLVDTGGVDIADQTPITRSIVDQAREAVADADLVLFVVDAQLGITPGDEEVAQILREAHKPVLVLANRLTTRATRRSRSSCTGSASATRSPSPACTGSAPATFSTRSSTPSRRTGPPAAPRRPRTRSASPSSAARTSASRASSTLCSAASA